MSDHEAEPSKKYEKAGKRLVQAVEVCLGGLATVVIARTALSHSAIEPIVEGLGWGTFAGSIVAGPVFVGSEISRANVAAQQHDGQQGMTEEQS